MPNFVHLHVHSYFSTLDGLGSPIEYAKRAKELGQPALALTDHGETSGLYEHQKACEEVGIKPILGSEFYIQDPNNAKKNGHILVLAKNNNGLRNIFKMQEIAFVENFYRRPRINMDILKEHADGLIVTSACLANPINQRILEGELDKATDLLLDLQSIFGDDFYIEIQPNDIFEQEIVNEQLIRFADTLGIDLVATNDVHYTYKEDGEVLTTTIKDKNGEDVEVTYSPHEILLATQVKKKLCDEDRFRFANQGFYIKSRKEMEDSIITNSDYVRDRFQDAFDNTLKIVDKCNARIEKGKYLPHFHTKVEGKSEEDMLRELVTLKYRDNIIAKGLHNDEYAKDVAHELDVITDEGYEGYFLIVQDYANRARDTGMLIGDGRGSASGCKVAHVLGITTVNPQQYGLLFERFLAHGRVPDIDLDFADIDSIFDYLSDMYGEENVARIRTFGRLKPKAAIRRVLSAFNHPQYYINQVAKSVPDTPGITLEEALEQSEQLREFEKELELEFPIIRRFENVISHQSTHAGGVIIWEDLSSSLPIVTTSEDRSKRIVALDMDELEELGYFKFDILGLKTLKVIQLAVENIEKTTGHLIDVTSLSDNDPKVYETLQNGDLLGVFQLEAQVDKVTEQAPKNFDDLIAINALIRPGVAPWEVYMGRRLGQLDYEIHPDREWYMKDTYGLIVYQEQFLLDCQTFAGWGIAFADKNVRKNKSIENDVELRDKFIEDSIKRGYERELVEDIWEQIVTSVAGGYNFNKSHSTSYAKLSYRTAWLATYYPEEFYAALATVKSEETEEVAKILAHIKQKGIDILPPSINNISNNFEPSGDGIKYMASSIKNLGSAAIKALQEKGPFYTLDDLLDGTTKSEINKSALTNIIKAGVFDSEDENRIRLLNKAYEVRGYKSLGIPDGMWNNQVKLMFEKESMGIYISSHPLDDYSYGSLESIEQGANGEIAGEVLEISEVKDKNGNLMAFVDLDTKYGHVSTIFFSWIWKKHREQIKKGYAYALYGKRDVTKLLVQSAKELS